MFRSGTPARSCTANHRRAMELGTGWAIFDYAKEFACPVRLMNDACIQALGSYDGGRMLYLGFGTGIGTAFIKDGVIVPLALGHLKFCPRRDVRSFLEPQRSGNARRETVATCGSRSRRRTQTGVPGRLCGARRWNAKKIEELPPDCRRGDNFNAYIGGLRIWEDEKAEGRPR